MRLGVFFAIAATALLGASCSVQDFTPVVMEKPTIAGSFDFEAPRAEITTIDELEDYYGKYSFRYGVVGTDVLYSWSYTGTYNEYACYLLANKDYTLYFDGVSSAVTCYLSLNYSDGTYATDYAFFDASSWGMVLHAPKDVVKLSLWMPEARTATFNVSKNVLGMSYTTPMSGARTATYTLDGNGDINDRMVYSDNDAYPELRNFEVFFSALHWNLDNDTYEAFNVSLSDALSNATMRNIDGFDYDRDGWYEVMWTVEDSSDAYLEFEVGSPLPDKYKDTMLDGLESLYYSLSDGTNTKTGYITPSSIFYDAMDGLLTNGLLDIQGFKTWLVNRQDVTFSGGVEMQLHFNYGLNGKDLAAAPVYVDNKSYASTTDMALMPMVSAMAVINLGNRWTCFQLNLNTTYAGNATGYSNAYSTINDESYYRTITIFTPRNQSANELRYVGVLSSYARGYADGVASREGEVNDLSERILDLQEDLSQYQGMSYSQIYNLGKQAALDEGTAASGLMNGLIGSIVGVPLTILNNLTGLSMFGLPVMSAIFSLLIVAIVLWLYRRFKS